MRNLTTPAAGKLRIWLPALRAGSGADVFTLRLEEGLRRAGHDPVLQWFDRRYELAPWLLRRIQMPHGVDVIHTGSWQGFAFKRQDVPLVVTEHHCSFHPKLRRLQSPLQRLYHRFFVQRCNLWSYESADAIVAVSEFCASELRKRTSKPVHVIHNWIDTRRFSPIPGVARLHTPFRLLFVGNPSRWKGFDILAPLAKRLGAEFEIYCLAGLRSGESTKRQTGNIVRALPKTSPQDMPSIYRDVDAVLVPTRYETFGYVAVEAMACGVPVVGFNSAGTAEVCAGDENALLVREDDLDSLETTIRKLSLNPTLWSELGTKGRIHATTNFSEEKSIAAYLDIYRTASVNLRK